MSSRATRLAPPAHGKRTLQANQPLTNFSHSYNLTELRGPRAHLVWRTRGQTAAGVA
jgi:hypothetical protein